MAKKPVKLKGMTEMVSMREYIANRAPFDTIETIAKNLGVRMIHSSHGKDNKTQVEFDPMTGRVVAIGGEPTEKSEPPAPVEEPVPETSDTES